MLVCLVGWANCRSCRSSKEQLERRKKKPASHYHPAPIIPTNQDRLWHPLLASPGVPTRPFRIRADCNMPPPWAVSRCPRITAWNLSAEVRVKNSGASRNKKSGNIALGASEMTGCYLGSNNAGYCSVIQRMPSSSFWIKFRSCGSENIKVATTVFIPLYIYSSDLPVAFSAVARRPGAVSLVSEAL